MTRAYLPLLLSLAALTGCDQLSERAGFPDPTKQAAEGKAIGGACRHAGRGLEDCYALNPGASKSAVYEGWKEMNEYMAKNNMQAIPPQIDLKGKAKSRLGADVAGEEPAQAEQGDAGLDPEGKGGVDDKGDKGGKSEAGQKGGGN
ncbi:MAG: hypothetical protein MUC79_04300 [Thiobacillaceae bacterium]|jgi:hypothetical protein|nr:hypothetical protein [Thiobacillaceae bacterium]